MNRCFVKKYTFAQITIVLGMLMLSAVAQAAQVRAWIDRTTMQMGETVTLNVEITDSAPTTAPDFTALQQDFALSGTQSSNSVEIANGRTSAKLLWAVALEPKHDGMITIPSLTIAGQATQPITVTVQPMAAGGSKSGDDVYIEATTSSQTPYVQQQVTLSLKLFFAVNLVDGTLDDPQAEGVVVKRLGGQDANFSADVGGRHYRVLERRYVLQPERSGKVTLAPIMFRGHAMDRNDMNSFFTRGRNVTAHSEALNLDVRPRPASSGTDAWLPAQSVTLAADGLSPGASARVGEPLTLTLRLQAVGLGFEQLPELNLPKIDGADIYPDKASTQNRDAGDVVTGERVRKFAIMPKRSGPLTIPSIGIAWWDVVHDRPETASVPEVTLEVAATPGAPTTPAAPVATPAITPANETPAVPSHVVAPADNARVWQLLAIAAFVLWLVTVVVAFLVLRSRRTRPSSPVTNVRTLPDNVSSKARFRSACLNSDWNAVANALIAWTSAVGAKSRNLGEVARSFEDADQIAAVDRLQRVLYAGAPVAELGAILMAAFKNGPRVRREFAEGKTPVLPPLYGSRRGG